MQDPFKLPDRTEYGHDVEGNRYKVIFKHNEEVARVPIAERLIWEGGTANFGIKQYKRASKQLAYSNKHYLIDTFKKNSWNHAGMKDRIARTALLAPGVKEDDLPETT